MNCRLLLSLLLICRGAASAKPNSRLIAAGERCEDKSASSGDALLQTEFTRAKLGSTSIEESSIPSPSLPPTSGNADAPFTEQHTDKSNLNVPLHSYFKLTEAPVDQPTLRPRLPANVSLSFLHDVVGSDGVQMITVESAPQRFRHTATELAKGGVLATSFVGTDVATATESQLRQGCIGEADSDRGKCGDYGCAKKTEQALADSHRRALLAASLRKHDWTVILEDDVLLMNPDKWNKDFAKAWTRLQKTSPLTKLVRLSWCMIVDEKDDLVMKYEDTGAFFLSRWSTGNGVEYDPGLCTSGYMVHKDIIQEMLNLFPCCGPLDVCYKMWLSQSDPDGNPHGMKFMVSMDAKDSRRHIADITDAHWLGQHGVMYQDRRWSGHL
mmetsp:Transcript_77941/g.147207  ORF Transcript_77941/g.147207 Transcript_77941/m.147207 type:complete len:383 (+) Transcript_77941:121-1269(+)